MVAMLTLWGVLRRLSRLYAVFGLIHALFKVVWFARSMIKAKRDWRAVPGKQFDLLMTRMRKTRPLVQDFFLEAVLEHPKTDLLKLDSEKPVLLCNSEKSVKWMLKEEFANITKPGGNNYLFELIAEFLGPNAIFVLKHGETHKREGEEWYRQRKVASLIFTKSNFDTVFHETFVKNANILVDHLLKHDEEVVNLQELFFSFTMDSIEKFFMGNVVNTITGGMSEYGKNFDEAHKAMMQHMINSIPLQILARLLLPWPIGTWTPTSASRYTLAVQIHRFFDKDYKYFASCVKNLDNHVGKYILKTRKDKNLKNRKDVIANFLNSERCGNIDDSTLRDLVKNLTIAGRDTTACTLSWLFFELTQNLQVQEHLIAEIDSKLQGKIPTSSDLESENMPYLNGVVLEALRLHPPVPTDPKVVEKDIEFEGTKVSKGCMLLYCPYATGRNPQKFGDPLSFKPERWRTDDTLSFNFPVFQAGPRACLGKDFALFEIKLLTSMLLQHFRFKLKPGEAKKIGYSSMITMSIANDKEKQNLKLWCIASRRGVDDKSS